MSRNESRRTIVIGDVHGCFDELMDLLDEVDARPSDRLVSVGDLICKGPDSRAVAEWALGTPNLVCILGNHELRWLEHWRRFRLPDEKPYDLEDARSLGTLYPPFMRAVETWPGWISEPELLVVHGGFDPLAPLERQPLKTIANMRRLPKLDAPWYELYQQERLVVFGHWVHREPIVRPNAVGLDTGCVYGGRLTALVLPERRLVSVPARRVHKPREAWV